MLIYSQDRKSVADARLLQVQRSFSGGKDAKFCIMAVGESTGAVIAANYPEEKNSRRRSGKGIRSVCKRSGFV